MNSDNQRLKEIQQLKQGYASKRNNAKSMHEMFKFQDKIDKLEIEEKDILKRCDVII